MGNVDIIYSYKWILYDSRNINIDFNDAYEKQKLGLPIFSKNNIEGREIKEKNDECLPAAKHND